MKVKELKSIVESFDACRYRVCCITLPLEARDEFISSLDEGIAKDSLGEGYLGYLWSANVLFEGDKLLIESERV